MKGGLASPLYIWGCKQGKMQNSALVSPSLMLADPGL